MWTRTVIDGGCWNARRLGRSGGGRPIVFVPGLGLSHAYWLPTARRLARRHEVWLLDPPGIVGAPAPPRPWTLARFADQLAAWVQRHRLEGAVLVGNSIACQALVVVGDRHPSCAGAIVLEGMPFEPGSRSVPRQFARLLIDALYEPPSLWWVALRDYVRAHWPSVWELLRSSLREPIERRLPRVRVPVFVVRGRNDPLMRRAWAQVVTALLPGAVLCELRGGAHAVGYDAPGALARRLRRFVRSLDGEALPRLAPKASGPDDARDALRAARASMRS